MGIAIERFPICLDREFHLKNCRGIIKFGLFALAAPSFDMKTACPYRNTAFSSQSRCGQSSGQNVFCVSRKRKSYVSRFSHNMARWRLHFYQRSLSIFFYRIAYKSAFFQFAQVSSSYVKPRLKKVYFKQFWSCWFAQEEQVASDLCDFGRRAKYSLEHVI